MEKILTSNPIDSRRTTSYSVLAAAGQAMLSPRNQANFQYSTNMETIQKVNKENVDLTFTENASLNSANLSNNEEISFPEYPSKTADVFTHIRREFVEEILVSAPQRKKTTIKALCAYFKKFILSEEEKAFLLYQWVTENITFNIDVKYKSEDIKLITDQVLKTGEAVCSGYSYLYVRLANEIGIKAVYVHGETKENEFDSEIKEKFSHAWNAVRIIGEWFLIDTTWGAGFDIANKWEKIYDEYYFCVDPQQMIRSHFPYDKKWQLLKSPLSKKVWLELPNYKSPFYKYGFKKFIPDNQVIQCNGSTHIILPYFTKKAPIISATLEFLEGKNRTQVVGEFFIQQQKRKIDIELSCKRNGKYYLNIFAGENDEYVMTYKVIYKGKTNSRLPTQYPAYQSFNMQLMEPKTGLLELGQQTSFKISALENLNIALVVDSETKILEYDEKERIYKGDYIISSEDVCLYANNIEEEELEQALEFVVSGSKMLIK